MKVRFTGRHIDVNEKIKEYTLDKLQKLEKFYKRIIEVHVIFDLEKHRHIAEILLQTNRALIKGEGDSSDLMSSVDMAIDRIESQLKKFKDRLKSQRKRQAKKELLGRLNVYMPVADQISITEAPLVHTRRFSVKPMSVDEAIMQLNMSDDDFFVFTNSESEQVNVIYRRKDESIGMIKPEE